MSTHTKSKKQSTSENKSKDKNNNENENQPTQKKPKVDKPKVDKPPVKMISIFSHKGGVGKTSITFTIAKLLLKQGKRVLLIDLDPQMNLTRQALRNDQNFTDYLQEISTLDIKDEKRCDLASKFHTLFSFGQACRVNPITIEKEVNENEVNEKKANGIIDIIPGNFNLEFVTRQMSAEIDNPKGTLNYAMGFTYLVHTYTKEREYDFVLLDMTADLYTLNKCALLSSDYCIMPCELHTYSLLSMSLMKAALFDTPLYERFGNARSGSRLNMLGFIPNKIKVNENLQMDQVDQDMLARFTNEFSVLFDMYCKDKKSIYPTFFHLSTLLTSEFSTLYDVCEKEKCIREQHLDLLNKWLISLLC